MAIIKKEGFSFAFNQASCSSCSARCCRGLSGNVWVTPFDMQSICNLTATNIIDGMDRFFEKRGNRYSIRESCDGSYFRCVFLNNANQCSIYPVRPTQCRTFPFWEHFKTDLSQLLEECPGVLSSLGHSADKR